MPGASTSRGPAIPRADATAATATTAAMEDSSNPARAEGLSGAGAALAAEEESAIQGASTGVGTCWGAPRRRRVGTQWQTHTMGNAREKPAELDALHSVLVPSGFGASKALCKAWARPDFSARLSAMERWNQHIGSSPTCNRCMVSLVRPPLRDSLCTLKTSRTRTRTYHRQRTEGHSSTHPLQLRAPPC